MTTDSKSEKTDATASSGRSIDLEAALRLADGWEQMLGKGESKTASCLRGLVERVRELESEASANSVLLTAAKDSYQVAAAERDFLAKHIDFAACARASINLDGIGDVMQRTNYRQCTTEWELPDGRRAKSILEAYRMTRGPKAEEPK